MNKQKLVFKFGFAVILFISLLGTSIRAYAGKSDVGDNTITGAGGSTGTSDTSSQQNSNSNNIQIALDLNTKIKIVRGANGKVKIIVPADIQAKINQLAAFMRTNPSIVANTRIIPAGKSPIYIVIVKDGNAIDSAKLTIKQSLENAQISSTTVGKLVTLLEDITGLIASESVDVNQLSRVINSYNKLVKSLPKSELEKFAKDKNLQELKARLGELRNSLT